MNRDKVIAMFLGVAIGDALGMPVETLTAEQIAKRFGRITDYLKPAGHKWYDGWEAGYWTDDTQLTLAIAASLIAKGDIDLDDIAQRSIGKMLACSIGWGNSTKRSLQNIHNGQSRLHSGAPNGAGNGVAMKISPLAAFLLARDKKITVANEIKTIIELTIMTHDSDMAIASAFAQLLAVMHCLCYNPNSVGNSIIDTIIENEVTTEEMIRHGFQGSQLTQDLFWRIAGLESHTAMTFFKNMTLEQKAACFDGATCFVYNSLPFTHAMFLTGKDTIETLYDTVSAGGDTDTNGSMVGALLGALNGSKIFPQHLIDGLWQKDLILDIANRFCDKFDIK